MKKKYDNDEYFQRKKAKEFQRKSTETYRIENGSVSWKKIRKYNYKED